MPKLKIEDLQKIKKRVQQTTNLREGKSRAKITVHMGTCGIAAGARDIMASVMEIIEKNNVDDVIITTSGCAGLCSQEPMATIELPGQTPVKYVDLTKAKITQIFDDHVMSGKIVTNFALGVGSEQTH